MREAARRTNAGDSILELFTPDCVFRGNPAGWFAEPEGSGVADQLAASERHHYRYDLREILEDRADTALFSAVWARGREGARGAAGLFFGIVRTSGGLISRMDLFSTEAEAREVFGRD